MEFLLLLLPLALVGFAVSGSDDGGDSEGEADPDAVVREGGSGDDRLEGGDIDNLLAGGDGDDEMRGTDGDDVLLGEGQGDTLFGGSGTDLVFGGANDDAMFGEAGTDIMLGGDGDDALYGGTEDDVLIGVSGADSLYGGSGADLLSGLDLTAGRTIGQVVLIDSADTEEILDARFGADIRAAFAARAEAGRVSAAAGDAAPDLLAGGFGADALVGDSGDTLTGGDGADAFAAVFAPGDAPVRITDFNAAVETLALGVDDPAGSVLAITDGPDGAEVRVDGELAAILAGVQAGALPPGAITLAFL